MTSLPAHGGDRHRSAQAAEITWDACKRDDWNDLIDAAPAAAFEQTWMYGDGYAAASPAAVARRAVVTADGGPVALAQVFARRVGPVVSVAQLLRGPVLLRRNAVDRDLATSISHIRRSLKQECRTLFFWTPDAVDPSIITAATCAIRMRRVMTGHSSARVDLTQPTDHVRRALHVKWRNALTQAEAGPLRIEAKGGRRAAAWLLERYGLLRRSRRFGGPSAEMLGAVIDGIPKHETVLLRAFADGDAVGGALFLQHGRQASYVIGWTDPAARALNAGTLLLWKGMLTLKERGIESLDLGGIDTRNAAGIARFKLGTGGKPYTLPGTFL